MNIVPGIQQVLKYIGNHKLDDRKGFQYQMGDWMKDPVRSNHETLQFWDSDVSLAGLNRQRWTSLRNENWLQKENKDVSYELNEPKKLPLQRWLTHPKVENPNIF